MAAVVQNFVDEFGNGLSLCRVTMRQNVDMKLGNILHSLKRG